MIEITISNDPLTLGTDATRDDLETFGEALAETLAEEFNCATRCRLASVSRSTAGTTDGDYELAARVEERLHQIEGGEEWLTILRQSVGLGAD